MKAEYYNLALVAILGIIAFAIATSVSFYESEKAKAYATLTNPAAMCFAVARGAEEKEICAKLVK